MAIVPDEIVEKLISTLNGTSDDLCSTLERISDDKYTEDDLTQADHQRIDTEIFRCEDCGWWCEASEQHDAGNGCVCDDCFGDTDA